VSRRSFSRRSSVAFARPAYTSVLRSSARSKKRRKKGDKSKNGKEVSVGEQLALGRKMSPTMPGWAVVQVRSGDSVFELTNPRPMGFERPTRGMPKKLAVEPRMQRRRHDPASVSEYMTRQSINHGEIHDENAGRVAIAQAPDAFMACMPRRQDKHNIPLLTGPRRVEQENAAIGANRQRSAFHSSDSRSLGIAFEQTLQEIFASRRIRHRLRSHGPRFSSRGNRGDAKITHHMV
jgi:hypothetical protein